MDIVYVPVADLKPYAKNAKKHPPEQVGQIANSIKSFGFRQPLVIDADNVIVIGHGRLLAAKKLGLDKVPCVRADDLSDEQIRALRLADNKTNESDWDSLLLDEELQALIDKGVQMSDFGFTLKELREEVDRYSKKTLIPQYEPDEDSGYTAADLVDKEKVEALLAEIDESSVSEAEKDFLRIAAYRHAVIQFDRAADYYARASREMQTLMERSALVIIDIDNAIANGYTTLTETLDDLMGADVGD